MWFSEKCLSMPSAFVYIKKINTLPKPVKIFFLAYYLNISYSGLLLLHRLCNIFLRESYFSYHISNILSRITVLLWQRGLHNSKKLWIMLCSATQDGQVIMESSEKTWYTGGGNDKPLQYSCLETPWTVWKGKKIGHWEINAPGEKVSFITGEKRRAITISAKKREVAGPKQKWCTAVAMSGGKSKVWCCKEQHW